VISNMVGVGVFAGVAGCARARRTLPRKEETPAESVLKVARRVQPGADQTARSSMMPTPAELVVSSSMMVAEVTLSTLPTLTLNDMTLAWKK